MGQNVCHYLGGDKGGRGVKANGDKRWQEGEGGQILGFLPCHNFWMAPKANFDFSIDYGKEICFVYTKE